jgi:hypothetical protein
MSDSSKRNLWKHFTFLGLDQQDRTAAQSLVDLGKRQKLEVVPLKMLNTTEELVHGAQWAARILAFTPKHRSQKQDQSKEQETRNEKGARTWVPERRQQRHRPSAGTSVKHTRSVRNKCCPAIL